MTCVDRQCKTSRTEAKLISKKYYVKEDTGWKETKHEWCKSVNKTKTEGGTTKKIPVLVYLDEFEGDAIDKHTRKEETWKGWEPCNPDCFCHGVETPAKPIIKTEGFKTDSDSAPGNPGESYKVEFKIRKITIIKEGYCETKSSKATKDVGYTNQETGNKKTV